MQRFGSSSRILENNLDPKGHARYAHNSDVSAELGRGAFGVVYRALDVKTDTEVALKCIFPRSREMGTHASDQPLSAQIREVFVDWDLKHQHVVTILDNFLHDKHLYIVMELAHGGDLFEWVVSRTEADNDLYVRDPIVDIEHQNDAQAIISQMLLALEYAHAKGVSHRDLKPENILLKNKTEDKDIHVLVADWGMAYRDHADPTEHAEARCGTPIYVAPEVLYTEMYCPEGEKIDPFVGDCWSMGVLSFMAAHLGEPFDRRHLALDGSPFLGYEKIIDPVNPHIPNATSATIRGLMSIDRKMRFTASEAVKMISGQASAVTLVQVVFAEYRSHQAQASQNSSSESSQLTWTESSPSYTGSYSTDADSSPTDTSSSD